MKLTYTKVFAEDSLLAGLTFDETVEYASQAEVAFYAEWAESGRVMKTGAYGGSDYTISNVKVDCR